MTRDPSTTAPTLNTLAPTCVYTSLDEALADDQVDAVYLATPVHLHCEQAVKSLEAGKHVLVEKPMAIHVRDCEHMQRAAKAADRALTVAYYRRFWPTFRKIKMILDSGELGQIVLVRQVLHSWYQPPADQSAWRVQPELAGNGVLADVGSHRLDLLAWWFGLPKRVVADGDTRTQPYAAEDSVSALMLFEREIPCTVSFHWNSRTWADQLEIIGTEAKLSLSVFDGNEITITSGREVSHLTLPAPENAHYDVIDDFASAIVAGRRPQFDSAAGIAASRIIDLIVESIRRKTWIENS